MDKMLEKNNAFIDVKTPLTFLFESPYYVFLFFISVFVEKVFES